MRALAATIAFLMELALLAAAGWIGYEAAGGGVPGVIVAAVAVAAVVAIWGGLLAPRSARRLALWPRLTLEAVLFTAAAIGLAVVGAGAAALVFAGAAIVRFVLGLATGVDAEGL